MRLLHKFVKTIPKELEDGVIYISIDYATAIHKCCSGCGEQVVTPISPTDWKLTFDGKTISLYPSIGNSGLKCQSHYWITNNNVIWVPKWSKGQTNKTFTEEQLFEQTFSKKKSYKSFLKSLFKRK